MKARFINENIDFKRGQSSIEALDVGSFAIKVVKELKKLDKYGNLDIRISDDGDEIFIEGKNLHFPIELKNGTEIHTVDFRQHILFGGNNNDVDMSAVLNLSGQDSAEIEEWGLDKPYTAAEIAEEAEINYQNVEYNLEEELKPLDEKIHMPIKRNAEGIKESTQFKRTGDVKNTLGIGHKYKIGLHEKSYMYAVDEFRGTLEDAQKHAARRLIAGWDYANYRGGKEEDYWATFSEWNEKSRNEGEFYKDPKTGKYAQREKWVGGWDENFDNRIGLSSIDIIELRFNDKLVINDSKDRD